MPEQENFQIECAFEPFETKRLNLAGRLVRAPVWTGTADEDGFVTERTISFYEKLTGHGLGLITTGFAFVSANSRAVPRMLGVSSDDYVPGLKSLVDTVHAKGDKICLQIAHCGLNADPAYDPDGLIYGPSLIALTGRTQIEKTGKLRKENAHIMRSLTRVQGGGIRCRGDPRCAPLPDQPVLKPDVQQAYRYLRRWSAPAGPVRCGGVERDTSGPAANAIDFQDELRGFYPRRNRAVGFKTGGRPGDRCRLRYHLCQR